jgi:hypothetical protein
MIAPNSIRKRLKKSYSRKDLTTGDIDIKIVPETIAPKSDLTTSASKLFRNKSQLADRPRPNGPKKASGCRHRPRTSAEPDRPLGNDPMVRGYPTSHLRLF